MGGGGSPAKSPGSAPRTRGPSEATCQSWGVFQQVSCELGHQEGTRARLCGVQRPRCEGVCRGECGEALRPAWRGVSGSRGCWELRPPGPGESWSQQSKGGRPFEARHPPRLRPGPPRLRPRWLRAGRLEVKPGGAPTSPSTVLCVGTVHTGPAPHTPLCRSVPCPARGPGMAAEHVARSSGQEQRAEGLELPGRPPGLRWRLRTWTRVQPLSGFLILG